MAPKGFPMTNLKIRILRALAQWPDRALRATDIINAIPGPTPHAGSVQASLSVLFREGLVERDGNERGWFAITSAGLEKASQD